MMKRFMSMIIATIMLLTLFPVNTVHAVEEPEVIWFDGNYYNIRPFKEGMAAYSVEERFSFGKSGFVDTTGKIVVPPDDYTYEDASYISYSEGLASHSNDGMFGKRGYINEAVEVVIPYIYNYASPFSEGLSLVSDGIRGYGYIGKTGEIVIPTIHEYRTTVFSE